MPTDTPTLGDLAAPFLPAAFYLAKNRHGELRRETRTFNRPALRFEETVR